MYKSSTQSFRGTRSFWFDYLRHFRRPGSRKTSNKTRRYYYFISIFTSKNGKFFRFLCKKTIQNAGIIRNSGIIGGRALLEVLRYMSNFGSLFSLHNLERSENADISSFYPIFLCKALKNWWNHVNFFLYKLFENIIMLWDKGYFLQIVRTAL